MSNVVLGPNSRVATTGAGGAKGWKSTNNPPRKTDTNLAPTSPARGNMFGLLDSDAQSPHLDRPRAKTTHSPAPKGLERAPIAKKGRDMGAAPDRDRDRDREEMPDRSRPKDRDTHRDRERDREREREPVRGGGPKGRPRARTEIDDEYDEEEMSSDLHRSMGNNNTDEEGTDAVEAELKMSLLEYLDALDDAEVTECLQQLPPDRLYKLIPIALQEGIDKKEKDRETLFRLVADLHSKDVLTSAQVEQGFNEIFETLPDLRLDAPLAPKYAGHFLASGYVEGYLSDKFVCSLMSQDVNSGIAETVLGSFAKHVLDSESPDLVHQLFMQDGFQIFDFFKPANRNEDALKAWAEKNGLTKLVVGLKYTQNLKQMIQSGQSVDAILRWISDVPQEVWTDSTFVKQLLGLIVEAAVAKPTEEEQFKLLDGYVPMLKKILSGGDPAQQTEYLFEVQRICYEKGFPEGLLERLFRYLYDQELVLEQAFHAWADDKREDFDKPRALDEVASHLNWLNTAKAEYEDGDE